MSAVVSKGESYSPDVSDHTIITYQRRISGKRGREKPKGSSGKKTQKLFKTPVLSPMRFLKSLGDKMATAFRFVFRKKKKKNNKKNSVKATGSSSVKSKKFIAPDDSSHRSEAIADCIEFINSSSLNRSSSVSANTH